MLKTISGFTKARSGRKLNDIHVVMNPCLLSHIGRLGEYDKK